MNLIKVRLILIVLILPYYNLILEPHSSLLSLPEITSTAMTILNEEKPKRERKLNIIIHGIQESKSETPLERKSKDIGQANTLLQKDLLIRGRSYS